MARRAKNGAGRGPAVRPHAPAPPSERELRRRAPRHGASNAAIAEALDITLATDKSHVGRAMDKLDASSRTQIVVRARHAGLVG